MEKEIKIATVVDEDGEEYELEVVKEFEYKNKKYAILYEEYECDCDEECDCDDEEMSDGQIYVFEVDKNKDGQDTYVEVEEG
ncbi:MAG: DUF1292 domain-containing protein, partial [Bacilli bacterium]|nr:DUF1292 domain-containing protein [Bacilli bacterium]